MKELHLIPVPRSMTVGEGVFHADPNGVILLDDASLYVPLRRAADRHPLTAGFAFAVGKTEKTANIRVSKDASLPSEGYALTLTAEGAVIRYADAAGAFYGLSTLVQIVEECGAAWPCLEILDHPAFPTRGYMLDIGRNKVPTLAEMEKLCDRLAAMKINHVELYIEGIPFAYPSFPQMWHGRDVLTGEDVLALDAFCRERFIELVPTQNNFGHMDRWLKKEYRDLAECPDGFHFGGGFLPDPRCLNPLDPRSEALVKTLADDFLPYFSSGKYNICCDETLELGQGHAKEACEAQGKGRVYLEFLKKVCAVAAAHGKQPLFWDDILIDFPELLPELPRDVIALEWGYMADQPSEEHCKALHDAGVRFYVCPGTGAWNTMLGKTDQMIPNIRNAADYGLKYGAEGLLNTDWGDCGHPQPLSTSYSGIAYGAAMAWSPIESREMDLAGALDAHVFMDAAGVMGKLSLDAGNYFEVEQEKPHNITKSFLLWISGLDAAAQVENIDESNFDEMTAYLEELSGRLKKTDMRCAEAALIRREFEMSLGVISLMQVVGHLHKAAKAEDTEAQKAYLDVIIARVPYLLAAFREVWLARNKYSWMDDTEGLFTGLYNRAVAKRAELK